MAPAGSAATTITLGGEPLRTPRGTNGAASTISSRGMVAIGGGERDARRASAADAASASTTDTLPTGDAQSRSFHGTSAADSVSAIFGRAGSSGRDGRADGVPTGVGMLSVVNESVNSVPEFPDAPAGSAAFASAAASAAPPPLTVVSAAGPSAANAPASAGTSLTSTSRSVRFNKPELRPPPLGSVGLGQASEVLAGSSAGSLVRGKSHASLTDSVAREAAATAASPMRSHKMDFLQRLVAQNPLMAVVSDDFRVCARLSLQALRTIAERGEDGARQLLQQALSAGISDAEAAQCLGLVSAFEERLDDKLQSLMEYLQTSFVSIGKKLAVPLLQAHMFELGRAMTKNLAVVEGEHGVVRASVSSASGSGSRRRSRSGSAAGMARRASESPRGNSARDSVRGASLVRRSTAASSGQRQSSTAPKAPAASVTTSVVQVVALA